MNHSFWKPRPNFAAGLLFGLLCLFAVAMRVYALGRVPGINGDEAWYGVNVLRVLGGGAPAWRTPPGNLLNPFYSLPLLALQAVLPVSFTVLRLPALLTGLALIPLTYLLVRRLYDTPTAIVAAVFAATLPVNIAYSRFGWDASQTVLASLLVLYAALRGRWLWCALAFVAAYLVHPTNVFLLPIVAVPALTQAALRLRRGPVLALGAGVIGAGLVVGWLVYLTQPAARQLLPQAGARLVSPGGWLAYLSHAVRLFSGSTVFRYVCGSGCSSWDKAFDTGLAVLGGVLLAAGGWRLVAQRKFVEFALVVGWLVGLGVFYIAVGDRGIVPHYERYALFLVMPGILSVAVLARAVATEERPHAVPVAAAVLGAAFLLRFLASYMFFMAETGGQSHVAFWTGPREPKQAAWELIRADAGAQQTGAIYVGSWWSGLPLAYLSWRDEYLGVRPAKGVLQRPADAAPDVAREYVVAFAGDATDTFVRRQWRARVAKAWAVTGNGDREILRIYRLTSP